MKAGSPCPKCGGQMLADVTDKNDLSCVQCGYITYGEIAEYDDDRRNLKDNRQAEKPFAEYRRALCHCKTKRHRNDCEYRRMLKEIGIDDPTK